MAHLRNKCNPSLAQLLQHQLHHMVRSLSAGMPRLNLLTYIEIILKLCIFRHGIDSLPRSFAVDDCKQSQDRIFCSLAEEHQPSTERVG